VTTVEIRSSPFASAFAIWTDRPSPALTLPFPFTLSASFLDLFLAVRQRLTASVSAHA
jgi:hypothetical protein